MICTSFFLRQQGVFHAFALEFESWPLAIQKIVDNFAAILHEAFIRTSALL
jgi:hypothetical protein